MLSLGRHTFQQQQVKEKICVKLKRGKELTSTKMETVPLSGNAVEFLPRRDTCLTHTVENVWRRVCFGLEPRKVKYFSLAYSLCFSLLHYFHFLSCLSPFPCFPLFLFSPSFLFLSFCLVSIHLVSFCLRSVLLY